MLHNAIRIALFALMVFACSGCTSLIDRFHCYLPGDEPSAPPAKDCQE